MLANGVAPKVGGRAAGRARRLVDKVLPVSAFEPTKVENYNFLL